MTEKEAEFLVHVMSFDNDYTLEILGPFFDYWSEPNKRGKMKWELEKTWDTKRRLQRWLNNQNKWDAHSNNSSSNGNGNNKTGTSAARIEVARSW